MKNIETRDVQLFAAADKLELRAGEGDSPSVLLGYAAVFNSDSEDLGGFVERLLPGSFADSLTDGSDIRALVGHDDAKLLGRSSSGTLRLAEDERGLRVEIDLPNVSYANDLRE
ncbi:MAG TPA: HK97 family phage prohead protease, partial [Tepidisphaeraceae bacterium]